MGQAVTITGTRSTRHRPLNWYRDAFETYVRPFAGGEETFHLGGATGIDSLCLLWLASETTVRLVVVVPATLADQPADARHAVDEVRGQGRLAELVELGLETRTDGYHARNRWMVDHSDLVIGFPLAGEERGGTGYTLDYARSQHKARLVIPI